MSNKKTSKQLIEAGNGLADRVENELISKGEVAIEVRGLTFQEVSYARSKARKIEDEDGRDLALRQWYLRFGVKAVGGTDLPRETLDIGICKLAILPEAALEQLYTYPDIAEALFTGIVGKTHSTEDELDRLDFTSLFTIPTSPATAGTDGAKPAQA